MPLDKTELHRFSQDAAFLPDVRQLFPKPG
jgi:hypothetical protein